MKTQTKFKIIFTWLAMALVYSLLGTGRANATDSGACYSIQDADARTYCLARAHRDAGQCYSIQRDDMRAMCLAEVRQ